MAKDHKLVEVYEKSRVKISDKRVEVPRQIPFTPGFNQVRGLWKTSK
jgi:hypothetical protein